MSSLPDRARRVGRDIDPGWDAAQVETSLAELHRQVRRRRRLRVAGAMGAATLVAGAAIYAGVRRGANPDVHAIAPTSLDSRPSVASDSDQDSWPQSTAGRAPAPQLITTRAIATPLSADAIVYASDDRRDAVGMRLERGAARFKVRHAPETPFRVDAGSVLVEVLGTEFTIARDSHRATVSVISGAVRADWHGGTTTLRAGQTATFPPADRSASAPAPHPPRETTQRPPHESMSGQPAVDPGDEDDVDALLEAADRARLNGRTDDAVSLIERVLARSLDPEREVVAAFALAHVRNKRGEYELAAKAFARAHAAGPDGALAEDALAREVQAWARANNPERAREAALRYQTRYPNGRRSKMVREFDIGD